MTIEKEKFFEILKEVSLSQGLNEDNLFKRIGDKLREINSGVYNTYSGSQDNVLLNKLFMIQHSNKIVNYTLLHLAVECESVPIVKLLLAKKVKVDAQISGDVNSKFTALHIAALHGHQEIMQLLLDNHANPLLKDSKDQTPRNMVGDIANKNIIIEMLKGGEQRYATSQSEARATRRQTYGREQNDETQEVKSVAERAQAWNARNQKEDNGTLQKVEQQLANNQKRIKQTDLHNQHTEQRDTTHNGEQTSLNKSSSSNDSGIYIEADESEALSQSILEDGEDIDAQDENGRTLLHHAAGSNRIEVVKYLVESGANVKAIDKDGRTPLHFAAAFSNLETVKYLVENRANVKAIDKDGRTPLHFAAAYGHVKIAKYLIDNRASVNARDKAKYTPLYYAVANDKEKSAKLLIKHGADRSLIKDEDLIDRLNSMRGQLSEVVSSTSSYPKTNNVTKAQEKAEKVKKLRVKLKRSRAKHETRLEALEKQIQKENKLLEQKIQKLENENATLKDKLDKTESQHSKENEALLEKAQEELTKSKDCVAGHETRLEALNEENESLRNENATLNSKLGETKRQHSKTEALLRKAQKELEELKSRAGVGATNEGWTPLHSAVKISDVNVTKDILKTGKIDLNATDKDGWTLLHYAAHDDHLDKVKYLVEEGADFEIKDKNGKSPLHLAAMYGHLEVVKYLVEEGANLEARDKSGKSPLDLATGEQHNEVVKYLQKKIKSRTGLNEGELEKTGKKQFSSKVAYASLAAMLVVGAALSIASGLSALLVIATSVASALIAGGIAYTMSKPIAEPKPDTELKEVAIQGSVQHDVCKI